MASYISVTLQQQVREDAGRRCGYCLSSEMITGIPLEIEHIIPESIGGATVRENLWLACHRCNKFKGSRTDAVDPVTQAGRRYSILVCKSGASTFSGVWMERK